MTAPKFPEKQILLVDDDEDLQRSFAFVLNGDGINNVRQCTDSRQVKSLLAGEEFEIVLLDLNMPHVTGQELLPVIAQAQPDSPVIVITGLDEVKTAVKCMKDGAFDYIVKPIDEETLLASTRRAIAFRSVKRENTLLKQQLLSAELTQPDAFDGIVTGSKSMHALFQYIEAVAATPQPILITGETGVGKELVAKAIHRVSGRKGSFVPVNIAGLDDNVFSDSLFGHLRGAYTGATEPRKGLIEQAAGGTLFLDEIGEMNTMSQVKLLRLLQEREYFPLGSDVPKHTDARVVVATNQNLADLLREGKFREDLFFRLRSHHVNIPPLRERREDIPLLVDHFLDKAARMMGKKKPTPPRELFTLLSSYHFPGNVREMEAMFYNAVSIHRGGMLSLASFEQIIADTPGAGTGGMPSSEAADCAASPFEQVQPLPSMRESNDLLIEEALRRTEGNQSMAAKLLGITRQTLSRHLRDKRNE